MNWLFGLVRKFVYWVAVHSLIISLGCMVFCAASVMIVLLVHNRAVRKLGHGPATLLFQTDTGYCFLPRRWVLECDVINDNRMSCMCDGVELAQPGKAPEYSHVDPSVKK